MSKMSYSENDIEVWFSDFADNAVKGDFVFPVIFDELAKDFSSAAGVVAGSGPEILVKAKDAESFSLKRGDLLRIDKRDWTIVSNARIHSPGIKLFKLQAA
jgi:hypothetical protein